MASTRTEKILDFAEIEMRKGGFDAVSFRDIAEEVGIKSASVHYHFPSKADLGQAVAKRYTERFIAGLGAPLDPAESPRDRIARIADAYLHAYRTDGANCLCAVFGSVAPTLPSRTMDEVRHFYNELQSWVATALTEAETPVSPETVISVLQGAMVLSTAREDPKPLEAARDLLLSLV